MKKFLANERDIPLEQLVPLEIDGHRIVVYRKENEVYALENRCPHQSRELDTGYVTNNRLSCRYHGVGIDVTCGAIIYDSGYLNLTEVKTYDVTLEDDRLYVEIE